jgi:hypothetical protein
MARAKKSAAKGKIIQARKLAPKPKRKTKSKAQARAKTQAQPNDESAQTARLPRIAKGKKPQYFADPATDKLLWMTLTLMEELSVTRDRLDTVERLLAKRRLVSAKEIDSWQPDAVAAQERAARRSAYVDRMMRAVHRELEELTRGDMPVSEAEVIAAVES